MRVVTPDTSLWEYIKEFINTLGGFQATVLVAAVFGVVIGACLWAWGSNSSNSSITAWGQRGIAGSLAAAFFATGIPKLIAMTIFQISS